MMLYLVFGFEILGPSLPNNTTESYQFCYISAENEVYGASSPFHFVANTQEMFYRLFNQFNAITNPLQYQPTKLQNEIISDIKANPVSKIWKLALLEKDAEITKLKKEVALLKKTLIAVVTKEDIHEELEDLKHTVGSLKNTLAHQQNEINLLKSQINNSKCNTNGLKIKPSSDNPNITEHELYNIGELKELPPFPFKNFDL